MRRYLRSTTLLTQHRMLVPLEFSGQRVNRTMASCNQHGCSPWATPPAMTVTWTERPSRVPRCRAAVAQPPPPSVTTFATALHAKFQNARCVNCHHFNAPGGLRATTHANRSSQCATCHTAQNWAAPPTTMDFSGRTAQQTCQMIKTFRPDAQSMRTHLRTDSLILWAINSGALPGGAALPIVPGGQAQWFQQVDTWVNGGMLCN